MLPATIDRVRQSTQQDINEQIDARTKSRLAQLAQKHSKSGADDGGEITSRLHELDEEWDIERTLEANAATVALLGLLLGATVDRRWYFLPGAVAGFLLLHAVQGWCPPLPLFRRLGVRTAHEIDLERFALKLLRGDFREAAAPQRSSRVSTEQLYRMVER